MSTSTTKTEAQARRIAAIREALLDSVTPEDMTNIGKALVQRGSEGHVSAAKLLFAYIFGKPGSMPEFEADGPSAVLTVPKMAEPAKRPDAKTNAAADQLERILNSPNPIFGSKPDQLINCAIPVVNSFNGQAPAAANKK